MSHRTFSGSLLRDHRRNLGISPTYLAYRVNRSYNSIRAYETGVVVPPHEVVEAIADVLSLPIDALCEEASNG